MSFSYNYFSFFIQFLYTRKLSLSAFLRIFSFEIWIREEEVITYGLFSLPCFFYLISCVFLLFLFFCFFYFWKTPPTLFLFNFINSWTFHIVLYSSIPSHPMYLSRSFPMSEIDFTNRNRANLWCLKNGGPSQAKMWWLFNSSLKLKEPISTEDRVIHAIMKAWSRLREGLVLMQPKLLDERLRQSLF